MQLWHLIQTTYMQSHFFVTHAHYIGNCETPGKRIQIECTLREHSIVMYWIVHNDQRHKKILGSGRSLATVFWSLSTAASDT